jgi:hypothetical protein
MDRSLMTIEDYSITNPEIQKLITARHREVSSMETPKNEVNKNFQGMDYVERSYMSRIADEKYPGWSFIILDWRTHTVKDIEVGFAVHGRLIWVEDGVPRQGDMTAGHQNQVLKDKSGYLSISNTWKSAVTECQKKAFNTYMNIADDVYRNIDTSLTGPERTTLLKLLTKIDADWLSEEQGTTMQEMDDKILNGTINKASLNLSTQKIEKWIRLCEADLEDGWKPEEESK